MKNFSLKNIIIGVLLLVTLCVFVQFNRYKTFGTDGTYYVLDRLTGKIHEINDVLEKEVISREPAEDTPIMEEAVDAIEEIDTISYTEVVKNKPKFNPNQDYQEITVKK